jgi:uncharacterized lipoprotein YddW (UPF0748 family)
MMNVRPWCRCLRAALALAGVWAIVASASGQIGRPAEKPKPPPEAAYEVKGRVGEVRATWLRLGESDYLSSPGRTADTMKRLRELGFNTVYVTVWQDGYPLFPSATFQKAAAGADRLPTLGKRDLLGEALIEAHRNGLLFIAGFDGGLVATRRDQEAPLVKAKQDWILRDEKGAFTGPLNSSWLNPAHPDVRVFLTDLLNEVIEKYDIDGLQFDERMGWPGGAASTLGHDKLTKDLFAKEVPQDANPPPKGAPAPVVRWREQKAGALVRALAAAVKKARPGLIVSFATPPQQAAMDQWSCDWPALLKAGIFDEIVIKTTAPGVNEFKTLWTDVMTGLRDRRPAATVSLRALGDGPDLSWPDLRKEIEMVREAKAGGFALTPLRSPLFTHTQGLQELLDISKSGRVRHPLRPLDWRPGPMKPTQLNHRGQYLMIRGLPAGFYRVITGGREPGVWVESKLKLAEGAAQMSKEAADELQAPGATVEFLIDRRADNGRELGNPDLSGSESGTPAGPQREKPPSREKPPGAPAGERPPTRPPGGG